MTRRMNHLAAMATAGFLSISAGSAWAGNPTTWTIPTIEVSNSSPSAAWTSPTALDLGYPQYQYTYEITQADANIPLLGGWNSVLDQMSSTSGNGTFGALPVTIQSQHIDESLGVVSVSGDVSLTIDSSGYAHFGIANFSGSGVNGLSAAATVTVTGVPEPTSLSLIGLIGGMILVRRRKPRAI